MGAICDLRESQLNLSKLHVLHFLELVVVCLPKNRQFRNHDQQLSIEWLRQCHSDHYVVLLINF